jgi:hypothetical protein
MYHYYYIYYTGFKICLENRVYQVLVLRSELRCVIYVSILGYIQFNFMTFYNNYLIQVYDYHCHSLNIPWPEKQHRGVNNKTDSYVSHRNISFPRIALQLLRVQ